MASFRALRCRQWRTAKIAKLSPSRRVQTMTMPPTNLAPSAAPLDYAPAPRNRRWINRVIVASLLLGVALVVWKWGPTWWRRAEILHWQHQCLQCSLSPDTIVYEEDPTEVTALLAGNPNYHPYPLQRRSSPQAAPSPATAAALHISDWDRLTGTLPGFHPSLLKPAVIFLHERISPAGHRRLVCVTYGPSGDTFTSQFVHSLNCDTFTVTPGTWSQPPIYPPQGWMYDVLTGWPRKPPLVRIFAGQPDPNDPAHFTIRYRIWGQEDVLDGHLLDNDQVTLMSRKQPQENN
jgi:hypothetical protein